MCLKIGFWLGIFLHLLVPQEASIFVSPSFPSRSYRDWEASAAFAFYGRAFSREAGESFKGAEGSFVWDSLLQILFIKIAHLSWTLATRLGILPRSLQLIAKSEWELQSLIQKTPNTTGSSKKFNRYFFTILHYALEKIRKRENKIKASFRSRSNSKNRKTSKTKTQTEEADKYSPCRKSPYAALNNNVLSIQVWKEPWHIQWCSQLWKRTQESSTSGKSLNILEKPHIWDQRAQVTSAQLEGTFKSSSLQKTKRRDGPSKNLFLGSKREPVGCRAPNVEKCSTDRQNISISLLSLQLRIQKPSWKHRHALHTYLEMSVTGRNQQLQGSSEYFLRSGAGLLPFMLNSLERAQWHRS